MLPGGLKDITAYWLNEVLHVNGYLTGDTDIISITMTPMAVGEGFQSDMARITPVYSRNIPGLPKTMVAKLPTTFEAANYVAMLFNTYEREIRFYKELAKKSPMRTPGLIYGEFDAANKRYVLILEDCAYCRQVDQVKGLTEAQLQQTIIKIADFHAHWWDSKELVNIPWMPGPRSQAAYALVGFYRSCWDMAVQVPDFHAALPPGGKEVGLKIYEHYQWMIDEAAPYDNLTITHFDFRGDNLFFDEANKSDPVVVFDWQAASKYRGPIDIAYLIGGSVSIELRHKIEKQMFDLYYNRLLERGVKGYPLEECRRDYLGGLLIYAYIPVLAYSRLDISSERGKEMARILTQRHFSAILDNDALSFLPE
ncbi:MAG: phosphotransferase [Dehalococcoidia bacterium]|nr:phosphotransferase [Dehalococcoidia bacterium]